MLKVKDYMIRKKEIVIPGDSVSSAIELMIENDIGSVVVEDDKTEKVVGIFTERDLLRRFMTNRNRFLTLTISEVMTTPVITVMKETPLAKAVRLMKEHDIGRIPVVDQEGKCEGILFWKDIFNDFCIEKIN